MKIAFLHDIYPAGGAEKMTADLAKLMSSKGNKIYMFVDDLRESQLSESDKQNITFFLTNLRGPAKAQHESSKYIADTINREGIDILLIADGRSTEMMRYLKENAKVKIVTALHSMPLWHLKNYFDDKPYKARKAGLVKIAEWYLVRYPHEFVTGRRKRVIMEKYRSDYRYSDTYTVLCEPFKRDLIKALGPAVATPEDNHVEVVPNYIHARTYPEHEKEKRVLYIGRLNYPDKRVDRLLDIWARVHGDFPDWRLDIVGSGEEDNRLRKQCRRLNLTNVEFHDYSTEPAEYYRRAAIVCLTSTYEGWPLVFAEGQQAGVVPIAFDCSAGLHELISPDGSDGVLVEPFSIPEYARQLALLMADEPRRRKMSAAAKRKAEEYSNPARKERWAELFGALTKK